MPGGLVLIAVLCAPQDPAQASALAQRIDALIDQLTEGPETDRWQAADELARLATPAALPLVGRVLVAEPEERPPLELVKHALVGMGPGAGPAVQRLADELRAPRPVTYYLALELLAEVAPFEAGFAPLLEGLTPPTERMFAAFPGGPEEWYLTASSEWFALETRRAVDPLAPTEELIARLDHVNPLELEFVCRLLARRGHEARRALPALSNVMTAGHAAIVVGDRLTRGYEHEVQRAAAAAIIAIAPDDEFAVPAFARQLWGHPMPVRRAAARGLGRLGPLASDAVPALIRVRDGWGFDGDDLMRDVVTALGDIGPSAGPAVPMLEELAREVRWDDDLVERARRAIAKIRG
jgi:HEAT repeat protein